LAAGTYTLTAINNITIDGPNGLPFITTPLTIKSTMAAPTIIERSIVASDFRLFQFAGTGDLSLDGHTLRNVLGAYSNLGPVVLVNSLRAGNIHGLGAGVSNNSIMTIVNSTLSRGTALV
jgi:hypothetical protein